MRIRRPRECYHVVYFRGKFWEIDEGGFVPLGLERPFAVLSYFAPGTLDVAGWYGGWVDSGAGSITKHYLGTHRRRATRWLKANSFLGAPRNSRYISTNFGLDSTPPLV